VIFGAGLRHNAAQGPLECIFSRYVDRANTGVGLIYANGRLHAAGSGLHNQIYDEKRIANVL